MYNDEEVALILREAAQSANSPAGTLGASSGLSLRQIKAAAAEAGIDPALVEQAALRILQRSSESFFERVAGGPIRHRHTIRLPIKMSKETSTRLMSAIRATADKPGKGHADSSGFSWHEDGANRLSVTAHEDSQGTRVQVLVDRSRVLGVTVYASLIVSVMPLWMLIPAVDSYADLLVLSAIPAGVLAVARAFWKSSTRSIRDRMAVLLDAVRQSPSTGDDEGASHVE